jgi:hypothetical protein
MARGARGRIAGDIAPGRVLPAAAAEATAGGRDREPEERNRAGWPDASGERSAPPLRSDELGHGDFPREDADADAPDLKEKIQWVK